jgi:hypothetical protein
MIQCRSSFGFAPKPDQRMRIIGNIIWQELQSYKTVESRVLGLVNDTHAAATEFLDDAVVRDSLADQFERHSGLGRQS